MKVPQIIFDHEPGTGDPTPSNDYSIFPNVLEKAFKCCIAGVKYFFITSKHMLLSENRITQFKCRRADGTDVKVTIDDNNNFVITVE